MVRRREERGAMEREGEKLLWAKLGPVGGRAVLRDGTGGSSMVGKKGRLPG